jgi:putative NADPH-quinone reductase
MAKQLVIIDGHPDPDPKRFCHALAAAYAEAARNAGHAVRIVTVSNLDLPLLRSAGDWEGGSPPASCTTRRKRSAGRTIWCSSIPFGSAPCPRC